MQNFNYQWLEDDTFAVMGYDGDEEVVTIPSTYGGKTVSLLYDDLFKGHSEIKEIHLPDHLRIIGGFVFDGCENLKSLVLPPTLTDMWQYAFVRSGIEVIEIPGSVERIIPFTFAECEKLSIVVCRKGTKKIYNNAFRDCPYLRMVVIPEGIEVGHGAFEGCPMISEDVRVKLKSRCNCPTCRGLGEKKLDVKSLLGHK